MKLHVDVSLNQLLELIRQLSNQERSALIKELAQKEEKLSSFQSLLLSGPTWTDETYQLVKEAGEAIDKVGL